MNKYTKEAKKIVGNWYVQNNGPYDKGLTIQKPLRVYDYEGETKSTNEKITIEDRYFQFFIEKNDLVYHDSGEMHYVYNNLAKPNHFRRVIKLLFKCEEFEVDL
jgi:hypothetical protein